MAVLTSRSLKDDLEDLNDTRKAIENAECRARLDHKRTDSKQSLKNNREYAQALHREADQLYRRQDFLFFFRIRDFLNKNREIDTRYPPNVAFKRRPIIIKVGKLTFPIFASPPPISLRFQFRTRSHIKHHHLDIVQLAQFRVDIYFRRFVIVILFHRDIYGLKNYISTWKEREEQLHGRKSRSGYLN